VRRSVDLKETVLPPTPVQTAEDLSSIAFGFMASKALFAALHVGLFDALAEGPQSAQSVAQGDEDKARRLQTLMTALAGAGVLEPRDDGRFANAPATQAFMVRGEPGFFGDYLRLQIDRQMYPMLQALEGVVRDGAAPDAHASYAAWMEDPEQARLFSESQHAGSRVPGRQIAKRLDLDPGAHVLDVAGGTGAVAIEIARRFEDARVTVLDFPNVVAVGPPFTKRAGVADRVEFVGGDALHADWPAPVDAVVMSYLWSGVGEPAIPGLLERARAALKPGGVVAVHDFMVDDDHAGPPLAALWALQHMVFTPQGRALTPAFMTDVLAEAGFGDIAVEPLIPGMTRLASARL
jgi:ubiquinone/menaquinone biosynthesis C-methylase UbiE